MKVTVDVSKLVQESPNYHKQSDEEKTVINNNKIKIKIKIYLMII